MVFLQLPSASRHAINAGACRLAEEDVAVVGPHRGAGEEGRLHRRERRDADDRPASRRDLEQLLVAEEADPVAGRDQNGLTPASVPASLARLPFVERLHPEPRARRVDDFPAVGRQCREADAAAFRPERDVSLVDLGNARRLFEIGHVCRQAEDRGGEERATAAQMNDRRRRGAAGAGATAAAAERAATRERGARFPRKRNARFPDVAQALLRIFVQAAGEERPTAAGVSAGRAFHSGGSRSTAVSLSVTS